MSTISSTHLLWITVDGDQAMLAPCLLAALHHCLRSVVSTEAANGYHGAVIHECIKSKRKCAHAMLFARLMSKIL